MLDHDRLHATAACAFVATAFGGQSCCHSLCAVWRSGGFGGSGHCGLAGLDAIHGLSHLDRLAPVPAQSSALTATGDEILSLPELIMEYLHTSTDEINGLCTHWPAINEGSLYIWT